jgi:hypothetical protein
VAYIDTMGFEQPPAGLHKLFLGHGYQKNALSPRIGLTLADLYKAGEKLVPGPDIEWNPSYEKFVARVSRLAQLPIERPTRVPIGFPDVVIEPWVWTGEDLRGSEDEYILELSASDVDEIEDALRHFKSLGLASLDSVSRQTFPLPRLKSKLDSVAETLHDGFGFTIIRGLEPREYIAKDNVIIYLGITSYIAETRGCQDSSGSMLSGYHYYTKSTYDLTESSPHQRYRIRRSELWYEAVALREQCTSI